jgi:hypothetical protein
MVISEQLGKKWCGLLYITVYIQFQLLAVGNEENHKTSITIASLSAETMQKC